MGGYFTGILGATGTGTGVGVSWVGMVREGYLIGIFMVPHFGVFFFLTLEYWGSSMRGLDVGFLLELVYEYLLVADCDCFTPS